MTYLALASLALAAISVLTLGGIVRWLVRAQARERAILVSQVLYLSGRTWENPPAQIPIAEDEDEDADPRDLEVGNLLPEHIGA